MADFPIAGIGSSAGGLDALERLFDAMPADPGVAFVVIAHLDPTRESHLTELLSRHTKMPVVEVQGELTVEANHVSYALHGGGLISSPVAWWSRLRTCSANSGWVLSPVPVAVPPSGI